MRKMCFLICTLCAVIPLLRAQQINPPTVSGDSLGKYYDMSLEELRNLKSSGMSTELEAFINSLITVASQKALSTRESPSAITLISEEEIMRSGARDLIDVLRLVPGFEFAYDGSSAVGIGVRGNWANEGKVLLQVDGVQVNEIFSGSTSFGNNFPIASIARIEIIRGPGSAIYGGFAELGVINIITKSGNEINGGYISGTWGEMKNSNARRTVNLGIGKKIDAFEFSLTGVAGQGNRSDQDAFVRTIGPASYSITGNDYTLANNSATNPFFWNARASYKNLSLHILYDNYKTDLLSVVDQSGERFLTWYAQSLTADIKYDWKLSNKLTLSPDLFFTWQSPGLNNEPDTLTIIQNQARRLSSTVTAAYNYSRKLNIVAGATYFTDVGSNDTDSLQTINGTVRTIQYHTYALFGQLTAKYRIANLVLGARYEYNSKYGDAFVPRIAITKRMNRFHAKLLYSRSFRAPTIQNIARGVESISSIDSPIKPEYTSVSEIETGYQFTRYLIASLNIFHTSIKDPIIYITDLDLYTNFEKSGSRGVELELRMKKRWGSVTANYSFYTVANQPRLQAYATKQYTEADTITATGDEASTSVLLAFPAHKATVNATLMLHSKFSMNTSLIWISKRYGYDLTPLGNGNYQIYLREDKARLSSNVFFNWSTPVSGLDIGAGVYNLFNTDFRYMVPVFSRGASPLPSGSREYNVRVNYSLKYNKR